MNGQNAPMNVLPGGKPGTQVWAPAGAEWDASEWDFAPLQIPADVTRSMAATLLSMQSETGGWELARVLVHADGSRRVWLRRRPRHRVLPGPVL